MNLLKERILVLFTLVALVNCYREHLNEYEAESVSHSSLEEDQVPVKVGVTEGSTKVRRYSVDEPQPVKREVERHEKKKRTPEQGTWQVKPVKRLSKKAKKIHIYLNNDEPKMAPKPKKHHQQQQQSQSTTEAAEHEEYETQTKRTPELTTRADYFHFTQKDSVPAGSAHFKHSTKSKEENSAADSQVEGSDHHEHVKEKIKIKHHHHHHHHSHVKTVVKKEPYPVEKVVHVPVEKIVEKVVHVPVEKVVEKIVKVPYDRPYAVEKIVERKVPYAVKEFVTVPVDRPYPVEKIVEKYIKVPTPYPVEKKVHVPQPYPVPVEKIVEKRIPYPVVKEVEVPRPYPVVQIKEIKVPYPVEKIVEKKIPHPYPVIKEIKVPVYIQSHQKHQQHPNHQQQTHQHGQHQSNSHHQQEQHGQNFNGHQHEEQFNGQQLNSHYDFNVNHQSHHQQHQQQNQQNFDDSFFAGSKKYEKVQNSKHQLKANHDYQTTPPNHQQNHHPDTFRRTLKVPPKSQRPITIDDHPDTVTQQPQIKNVHTPLPDIVVGLQMKDSNVQKPESINSPNKLPVDLQTPQTPVGFKTQQAQQEQNKNTVSDNFYKFDHELPSHTPKPQPDLITEGSTQYETYSQAPQPHIVYVQNQPEFYSQMQQQYDHTQQAYIAQELMHQEQQQMQFDERRHQFDQQRLHYEEALRQHEQQLRNHEQIQQGLGDPKYQIQYPINVQYAYQHQPETPSQENPSEQNFQPSYGVMRK